jgi:hypothetical protein
MIEEREWKKIGFLDESTSYFEIYNKDMCLYKATLNNELVYIGSGVEFGNGGITKRLRDFTRKSDSARKTDAEKLMNKNQSNIEIEIFKVNGVKKDFQIKLKKYLIKSLQPKWNIHHK